jgi:hypothetical protein
MSDCTGGWPRPAGHRRKLPSRPESTIASGGVRLPWGTTAPRGAQLESAVCIHAEVVRLAGGIDHHPITINQCLRVHHPRFWAANTKSPHRLIPCYPNSLPNPGYRKRGDNSYLAMSTLLASLAAEHQAASESSGHEGQHLIDNQTGGA